MKRGHKIFLSIFVVTLAAAFMLGLADRFDADFLGGDTIGVLRIEGPIIDVTWYMEQARILRDEVGIRSVVLRLDTPGGAIAPTQELYSEILKLKMEKPVVVSMGTVAASGGYYLSCASDWIMSNPGTITGSVGVIMELTNMEKLFDKLGFSSRTIKSGKFKDTGSPFREMTKEEENLLQNMIMDTYEQFVEAVLEGRSLNREDIEPYLDGRIMTGRQALEVGLVDELGNYYDALEKAADLGGLPKVPDEIFEPVREKEGVLALLFGKSRIRDLVTGLSRYLDSGSTARSLQLWRAF